MIKFRKYFEIFEKSLIILIVLKTKSNGLVRSIEPTGPIGQTDELSISVFYELVRP